MGTTLVHEHVLVDFAPTEGRPGWRRRGAFGTILPHLQDLVTRGCRTLLECTPAYLGRDPRLLLRLSEASGLQIVTNTGYYGAANDVAVPKQPTSRPPASWRRGGRRSSAAASKARASGPGS
jgi:phosphotriesterase-related protein